MTLHPDPVLAEDTLSIRDLARRDLPAIPEFLGADRLPALELIGMKGYGDLDHAELVTAVEERFIEGWIVETADGQPVSLQLYRAVEFPGVWTGECITATSATAVRGAGTAAMTLALDRLFGNPAVARLMGYVAVNNPASRRLCDKLGFVEEGLAREQIELPGGSRVDAWLMGLLPREWKARRSQGRR